MVPPNLPYLLFSLKELLFFLKYLLVKILPFFRIQLKPYLLSEAFIFLTICEVRGSLLSSEPHRITIYLS